MTLTMPCRFTYRQRIYTSIQNKYLTKWFGKNIQVSLLMISSVIATKKCAYNQNQKHKFHINRYTIQQKFQNVNIQLLEIGSWLIQNFKNMKFKNVQISNKKEKTVNLTSIQTLTKFKPRFFGMLSYTITKEFKIQAFLLVQSRQANPNVFSLRRYKLMKIHTKAVRVWYVIAYIFKLFH